MRGDPKIVDVYGDRVEKRLGVGVHRAAAKYDAVHQIGVTAGFEAPAVLAVNAASGVLILERMHDITNLRDFYWSYMIGRTPEDLAARVLRNVGAILARIHRGLGGVMPTAWRPDASFLALLAEYGFEGVAPSGPAAILHGDFGFANVFLRDADPMRVVIIDPCQDGYTSHDDWTSGPVVLDIGRMLASLEGKTPLRRQPFLTSAKRCRLQSEFLAGYRGEFGEDVEVGAALAYGYAAAHTYFDRTRPMLGPLVMATLYNRWWKKNFPLNRKLAEMQRARSEAAR